MRSSTGLYVSRLDHVRALAAFVVYCWHFVHVNVPYAHVPDFAPLSLLEEGHAGVALFMVLSGYLFAKIIDGRPISLVRFYWNRLLRLVPLLVLVLAYWMWRGRLAPEGILPGLVLPTWPGGTWSIVVELHFYLLLPLVLMAQRRHRLAPLAGLLALALLTRSGVWLAGEDIRAFSYFTLGGCLDLFVMGMVWHELARSETVRRHGLALMVSALAVFTVFWHGFNMAGGYYGTGPGSGSDWLWIIIPTVEGLAFGAVIVGYENARIKVPALIDHVLARIGEASYSIYLLHFIVFVPLAKALAAQGLAMGEFHVSLLLAVATFPAIVLMALLSYHLVERPFLRLRLGYGESGKAHKPAPGPAPTGPLPQPVAG